MDLVSTASALAALDLDTADRQVVTEALRLATRLIRMTQAVELEADLRLVALAEADPTLNPEHLDAAATGRSPSKATAAIKRATTAQALPHLRALLATGLVGVEHLDAFATALRSLRTGLRPRLLEQEEQLAGSRRAHDGRGVPRPARRRGPRHRGRRRRRSAAAPAATHRCTHLDRARRHVEHPRSLRCRAGGVAHRGAPPGDRGALPRRAPRRDPRRSAAAPRVLPGARPRRSDARRRRRQRPARVRRHDRRGDAAPRSTRRQSGRLRPGRPPPRRDAADPWRAGRRFVPVVVDRHGVVVRQGRPVPSLDQLRESLLRPVSLDHGRSRRHASRDQRRALRAMYRSCGVPGCDRHVADCQPHHIEYWEHGGPTDLRLLLPLCKHHHDRLHAESWEVELAPDRSLVVRRHGEVIMTTGPPIEQWA